MRVGPRLVVSAGDAAIEFYAAAFGAAVSGQAYDGDRLVNAHMMIGDSSVDLTQEDGEYAISPTALGGTPVLLSVDVESADAAVDRMIVAGGEVVIPIDDRPYGRRDARVRDPFGHLWIVGNDIPLG